MYVEEKVQFKGKSYIFLIWYHLEFTIVYVFGVYDIEKLKKSQDGESITHLLCKLHISDIHKVTKI